MELMSIRSDVIYKQMIEKDEAEKEKLFCEKMLKPFEMKWKCLGLPIQSETGGNVLSALEMGGTYLPKNISSASKEAVEQLSHEEFWEACEKSIRESLEAFEENGIYLPVQKYIFTVMLSDPKHPMVKLSGDYCGDGGIPGYITGTIVPNSTSLKMLPVALAHETNHNVRWQFIKWHSEITLADMLVSEGLAEVFASYKFGEDQIGKWVTQTSKETLEHVIKPMIVQHLNDKDFNAVSSYLYGDEIMAIRGQKPVGMPYCGGYACGYAMIQYYLEKTGQSIYEATILPTDEIMKELEDFWK